MHVHGFDDSLNTGFGSAACVLWCVTLELGVECADVFLCITLELSVEHVLFFWCVT